MKSFLFTLIFASALLSCSSDGDPRIEETKLGEGVQRWQLVKMSGNVKNSETTGSKMEWQEYYLLNPDRTFIKSRNRNGVTTEATGIYSYVTIADEVFLEFLYTTENELIGSCVSSSLTESLVVTDDQLVSTWWACDGPGLFYERCDTCVGR